MAPEDLRKDVTTAEGEQQGGGEAGDAGVPARPLDQEPVSIVGSAEKAHWAVAAAEEHWHRLDCNTWGCRGRCSLPQLMAVRQDSQRVAICGSMRAIAAMGCRSPAALLPPCSCPQLLAARIMIEDCMCLLLDVMDIDQIFVAAAGGAGAVLWVMRGWPC